MDTGERLNNDRLIKAIIGLNADNNLETRNEYISSLIEAKYLVPATFDPKPKKDADGNLIQQEKVKVHFRILGTPNKEKIFPCFTDDEEFQKGFGKEEIEKVVLSYNELAQLILNSKGAISGFAINPYSHNMPVTATLIEKIEETKQNALKKQEMKPGSTVKLRTPAYQPIDMINVATEFFKTSPNVNAAYLQMMEKEDGEDEYLIAIDHTGDEQKLFADLMPIIKEYSFGIPISLTNSENYLGKKVMEKAEPFYQKEVQE